MFSPLTALRAGTAEVVLQTHLMKHSQAYEVDGYIKEAKAAFRLQWQFENYAIKCALFLPSVNMHLFTRRARETNQV